MSFFSKALPTSLKELRLHLCQTHSSSNGLRSFIQSDYLKLKQANPDLKVLIREAKDIPPRAFARFERGVESQVTLTDLSEGDVSKQLEQLVKSQGQHP